MKIKVNKLLLEMARNGLTVSELSKKSGVGYLTISKIKTGKKADCRPDKVGAIAKALGVDVSEIVEPE